MVRRLGAARTGVAALILGCGFAAAAVAQDFGPTPPPIPYSAAQRYRSDPALLEATRPSWATGSARLAEPGTVTPAAPTGGGTWTTGTRPSGNPPLANPILMSDGTVIAQKTDSAVWWRLTPDKNGNYATGTWAQIAKLPSGYTPRFFGSSVLPDGKVIIEGGEYNGGGTAVWTDRGALYDPVANSWTAVAPPKGWTQIGDAQATLLADGTYYQANCCDNFGTGPFLSALFDESTLTWTASGKGKFDLYDEEGWALLPTDEVLTVDAYVGAGTCGQNSELYDAATGTWSSAGNVGAQLADCANPGKKPSGELGPAVLRPDGSVVAFAGTTCSDSVNKNCANGASGFVVTSPTAIFDSGNGSWSAGPNIPAVAGTAGCPATCNYTLADAPAALEPNGTILFSASPNYQAFANPAHFFELGPAPGNAIIQVADPTASASADFNSFQYNFLVLPTGQIMALQTDGPSVFYYNPAGSPNAAWAPAITSVPTTLAPGQSYTITGTQLNGLSQGAYYGDDVQAATNRPLVVVTNAASGHVFYFKTTNSSTYSVAPNTSSTASFLVPAAIETGASTLQVVTNGIPSPAVDVTILSGSSPILTVSTAGNGTVTSSPQGIDCGVNATACSAAFAAGTVVSLVPTPAAGSSFSNWGGACSGAGSCIVTLNAAQTVSATFSQGAPPASPLVAAVLPESRSAVVNSAVTAFATIINTGNSTAPACAIAPAGNLPLGFTYQTTDATTNALTGTPNTPANIDPGGAQSFVIALTPTAALASTQVDFSFACTNVAQAPVETGVDTLLLSASTAPVADIVALAAAASNDGILHLPGISGANAFAVATVNLGAASNITVTADTGGASLPLAISLCETNPTSGQCLQPAAKSVTTATAAGATPTFAVFGQASGAIAFDPANNRVFVQFADPGNVVRGETSVAVETK